MNLLSEVVLLVSCLLKSLELHLGDSMIWIRHHREIRMHHAVLP